MKKIIGALVCLSALVAVLAPVPVLATEGATCANDSWCGFGEVCLRQNSWDVMGRCIHGAR